MTPIVHITDKEQALQRENANMLDTINKQAVSIEKLRKVVEMKDLTIEAQTAEIEGWKADQKENIAVTFKQQEEIAASERNLEQFTDELAQSRAELAALKAQPVQEPVAMTAKQVEAIVNAAGYKEPKERADFINGLRHCEVAHGITGAAPTQPVQKPVAWKYQCTADKSDPVFEQKKQKWAESGSGLWTETPLYAAPTQPVQPAPLTDAQIDALLPYSWPWGREFARAIEAAVRTGGAG